MQAKISSPVVPKPFIGFPDIGGHPLVVHAKGAKGEAREHSGLRGDLSLFLIEHIATITSALLRVGLLLTILKLLM